ncbi:PaaI family thioesterase [Sorangium sp. So ce1000]|uniref:PaaI family thioesterase n=1 Tax=Sorangium sp. So ce1000 TaxID=3133325 RepID=UPI003F5F65A1
MQDEFTSQIIAEIEALFGSSKNVEVPPKIFRDMQGRFVAYEKGKSLRAAFPILERYEGPSGVMQGGMVAAAFDNVYGPFSYLVTAAYCITMNLSTSFVRPITRQEGELIIEVGLVERTKQFLVLDGKASNAQGKLIAHSTSQWFVVQPPPK